MNDAENPQETPDIASPWPHGLAFALAAATLSLIFVGGLVTTYRAGMSVPDWPTTYGHWWYAVQAWFAATWDLFLEHSHRVLAQTIGLLSIATLAVMVRSTRRAYLRWLGVALLAGAIFQGTLGGLRVLADALLLARIHGCTAPLYFSLCVATFVVTGQPWQAARPTSTERFGPWPTLSWATTTSIYLAIVLGAQLRHTTADTSPVWGELWLWCKLIVVAVAVLLVTVQWSFARRRLAGWPRLRCRARLVALLLYLQAVLGLATWVANYGWPLWFRQWIWAFEYTVEALGFWQVLLTTTHVAVGALTLGMAVSLQLWSYRLLRPAKP